MSSTSIEWTEATWNPTVGCTRVSPGCKNCYALALHDRRHAAHLAGKPQAPQYQRPFKELQLIPGRLRYPLAWTEPRMIFVNSVSDLFHESIPDRYIAAVFGVMALAGQHTFQVLTKRAARMQALMGLLSLEHCLEALTRIEPPLKFPGHDARRKAAEHMRALGRDPDAEPTWPLPNVWLGVSIEDRKQLHRAFELQGTPATVRFWSAEPLLENLGNLDLHMGVDWVIVGGESGRGARACDVAWIRSIVQQCNALALPCFVKQLGSYPCGDFGPGVVAGTLWRELIKHPKGGDPDEWPEDLRVREWPTAVCVPT